MLSYGHSNPRTRQELAYSRQADMHVACKTGNSDSFVRLMHLVVACTRTYYTYGTGATAVGYCTCRRQGRTQRKHRRYYKMHDMQQVSTKELCIPCTVSSSAVAIASPRLKQQLSLSSCMVLVSGSAIMLAEAILLALFVLHGSPFRQGVQTPLPAKLDKPI